jgi:hypothetical protein
MGLDTVIPNTIIESDWGNSVADRVVGRFANATERDAAITSPVSGMIVWRTDLGAHEVRKGGAWVPLLRDQTRVGCSLTLLNQNIASGATATLAWTTELWDTDNYHPASGTMLTIPAGLGGVYSAAVTVDANGTLSATSTIAIICSGPANLFPGYIPAGNRYGTAHCQLEMTPAATIYVTMFNGHSGAANFSAHLSLVRLSA